MFVVYISLVVDVNKKDLVKIFFIFYRKKEIASASCKLSLSDFWRHRGTKLSEAWLISTVKIYQNINRGDVMHVLNVRYVVFKLIRCRWSSNWDPTPMTRSCLAVGCQLVQMCYIGVDWFNSFPDCKNCYAQLLDVSG